MSILNAYKERRDDSAHWISEARRAAIGVQEDIKVLEIKSNPASPTPPSKKKSLTKNANFIIVILSSLILIPNSAEN